MQLASVPMNGVAKPRHSLRAAAMLKVFGLVFVVGAAPAVAQGDVVVTSKPAHSLAAALLDGVAVPRLLIDGAASPHTYAMKPSDARAVNGARLLVRVSAELEPFTVKLISALPRSVAVLTLADAPGVTKLAQRGAGLFSSHGHEHGKAHAHGSGRDAGGGTDPHIWLDPANARAMADALSAAFVRLHPDSRARIAANAEALRSDLRTLDAELEALLKPLSGKRYLVLHDAYQYLETRYGLTGAGAVALTPHAQSGARRLAELRHLVTELDVRCMFTEPTGDARIAGGLTEGTSARVVTLDPEGLALSSGPRLYGDLMRGLARSMSGCLAGPAP